MTRNLRAHLKINHKTASSGFIKSPSTATATEAAPASACAPLVSLRLRLSYHQRMRERRERRDRESFKRAASGRRAKLTNNDSLNKSLLMLAEMIDEKETMSLGQE